ncbi:FAD-dependent oxidoreductase [Aerosticca soli]|uniref:Kynurenine 3-monooxygenase n=1 Tax=Aerosticca soli TaxID=2010829 RepID=A0A2Z6E5Z7_9GAMM|nr:FAD-dependent monooxygenase [Aerosticca soli]BBD80566.1 kynurenine 3-monooxygenase [Aerosticca soli]
MKRRPAFTVIGAGLVGALLARLLALRGLAVEVFEKRPDPRLDGFTGGRSINLALAERGLKALRTAGLAESALAQAVMMRGRMIHAGAGNAELHRYGVDDREVLWSLSRAALNRLLIDAAEAAGARFHFGQALVGVDFSRRRLRLADGRGIAREVEAGVWLGADGAGSALRAAMAEVTPLGEHIEPLDHGYKELTIAPRHPGPGGRDGERFALEPHALHIWPRGGYMCIALPNADGSFTVTLFLPLTGEGASFARLADPAAAEAFFAADFPDLLPLIPRFATDYAAHPVGRLATLRLAHWHLDDRAVLLGDAAHAIVPFHGQGMNCGFEDALLLSDLLADTAPATAFAEFQRLRQPQADAIARMALENYREMRDGVVDPHYLARRALGLRLAERAPRHFMSRYRMVSFTCLPYAYALTRGAAQDALLDALLAEAGGDAARVDLDHAAGRLQAMLPPLP